MLFQKAKQYESVNFKGLYSFIKFIDQLKLSNGDLGSAKIIGENDNVVRIMSIHKSKGLEFPVVFLVSTGKQFNLADLNQQVLLHQEMGIGVKYINYERQVQYDTLSKSAVKNKMLVETLSEEMRILYVALTRAKEKLIITGMKRDYEKEINKLKEQIEKYDKCNNKINPILIKKYKKYIDWILLVYFYEKETFKEKIDFNVYKKQELVQKLKSSKKEKVKILNILENKKTDKFKLDNIKNILNYSYPNINATVTPTKASVSQIKQMQEVNNNIEKIELPKPKFLLDDKDEKISATQRGTLIHLCLQKLDEKQDYDIQKINKLISNLMEKQIITKKESESINPYIILEFTKSNIWKELKQAKEIYKEKPFYINIPAKDIYNVEIDENILVQGIIDLYYINKNNELILVDYKTDYINKNEENQLITKYKKQLEIYQDALENALKRKVYKKYIYSTCLNKEIECF